MTTDANHNWSIAPNHLAGDFTAKEPNQKWVRDITYIHIDAGWLYLTVVLDLFSRCVVGWAIGSQIDQWLVLSALEMAIERRSPPPGLLHHSDRGSQYCAYLYRQLQAEHQMKTSMSGKGNCYDNAVVESFFATLKKDRVQKRIYRTRAEARSDMFTYIEGFYNRRRRYSAIGYLSPIAFKNEYALHFN